MRRARASFTRPRNPRLDFSVRPRGTSSPNPYSPALAPPRLASPRLASLRFVSNRRNPPPWLFIHSFLDEAGGESISFREQWPKRNDVVLDNRIYSAVINFESWRHVIGMLSERLCNWGVFFLSFWEFKVEVSFGLFWGY